MAFSGTLLTSSATGQIKLVPHAQVIFFYQEINITEKVSFSTIFVKGLARSSIKYHTFDNTHQKYFFVADCPSEGWLRRDRVSNCYLFGGEKMNFAEAQQVRRMLNELKSMLLEF